MNLAKYGQELAQATVEAADWVDRNPEIVRNEREGLLKDLRRAGRRLRTCSRSAARRASAGVFGASQAGKSYLISALASNNDNRLIALFNDKEYDFITDINPKNDSESTGLVTRFTMERSASTPPDYPVKTRLLTETDLVKILANTWFMDIKHIKDGNTDIAQELNNLKNLAGSQGQGISLDALENLQEYIHNNFQSFKTADMLDRDFWPTALELGQKLNLEDRVTLYSLIWDKNPQFTDLLRKLLQSLEKIGFAEELYCKLDALIPREDSIINVSTLKKVGQESSEIEVCTPAGLKTTLPKSIVTAIIAELVIVMKDVPKGGGDYFQETDLLDFPGYRSRLKHEDIEKVLEQDPLELFQLFLRGKVAYLFQRYCEDIELNNMLLCVGPSNQEVQDLPGVIKNWIATTHGAEPEDRVNKQVSLFFILTKADQDFNKDAGSPSVKERWNNRIKASLLNFFGTTGWTTEWTPDHPFNNLFLLRNPVYEWDSVMDYDKIEIGKDANGEPRFAINEKQIMDKSKPFVEEMHQGFLNSNLAKAHFRDLPKSWDALMTLNDGGIGYIRESLRPVCDPKIKADQLAAIMNETRKGILERLKKFYKSDDREEVRKEKEKISKIIGKTLVDLNNKDQLGILIESFSVSDNDVYEMHREAERLYQQRNETDEPPSTDPADADDFDLFDAINASATTEEAGAAEPPEDEASFYASVIEGKWVERLHQLAEDQGIKKFFGVSATTLNDLASEIATGAARCGLKDKLASEFRQVASYANTSRERIALKQAIIAARTLNTFIDWMGWNPAREPENERLAYDFKGRSKQVFPTEKQITDIPAIPDQPVNYSRVWLMDWVLAMTDMMRLNVDFDGETTINSLENNALGDILKTLAQDAAREVNQ